MRPPARSVQRVAAAPVVWGCAALLLLLQTTGRLLGDLLEAYDRAAVAAAHALVRLGHRLVALLGPLGRALRALVRPVWRGLRAVWAWLNVQVLLRMFRPLRRWAQVVVDRLRPVVLRLVARVLRVVAALSRLLRPLARAVEAVEQTAARLGRAWRRLWAPVLARVARWRRASA